MPDEEPNPHWLSLVDNFTTNYRFIPLSDKVAPSPWDDIASGDTLADKLKALNKIRFVEDGYSGVISYELVAKTPICVGDDGTEGIVLPTMLDRQPFISGRTIKGMFRSIFSIVTASSFGKIEEKVSTYKMKNGQKENIEEDPTVWKRKREGRTWVNEKIKRRSIPSIQKYSNRSDDVKTLDWATALFGHVDADTSQESNDDTQASAVNEGSKKASPSLSSRLKFSFALAGDKESGVWPGNNQAVQFPGAGPKPNFAPFYLSFQDNPQNPETTPDYGAPNSEETDVTFSGRKRVPVVNVGWDRLACKFKSSDLIVDMPGDNRGKNKRYLSFLRPKSENSLSFKGRIKFNNLKYDELAMLVWSVCLGDEDATKSDEAAAIDSEGKHWHSAGQLKECFMGLLQPCNVTLSLFRMPAVNGASEASAPNQIDEGNEGAEAKSSISEFLERAQSLIGCTDEGAIGSKASVDALLSCTNSTARTIGKDEDWAVLNSAHGLDFPEPFKGANFPFFAEARKPFETMKHPLGGARTKRAMKEILKEKGGLLRL